MRFWIIISLLFSLTNSLAQELNLSELRELYIEASFEEDKANELYELTKIAQLKVAIRSLHTTLSLFYFRVNLL